MSEALIRTLLINAAVFSVLFGIMLLVRGMMGHRKQRERQILKLLQAGPAAIADMVPQMYKGLDPRLTGAAGQSVRAHLIDLLERGLVARSGEVWSMAG